MQPHILNILRYALAAFILLTVLVAFVWDVAGQLTFQGLDGPLALVGSYAGAINRLILAILLATILVADFEVKSLLGIKIARISSLLCFILGLIGLASFINNHWLTGWNMFGLEGYLVTQYALWVGYIAAALIIFLKMNTSLREKHEAKDNA